MKVLYVFLLALLSACGDPASTSSGGTTPDQEAANAGLGGATIAVELAPASVEELEAALPGLVQRVQEELTRASGIDMSDLVYKAVSRSTMLDTLVTNIGHQTLDDAEPASRGALEPLSKGLAGIYSMDEKKVQVVLGNLEHISELFDRPEILSRAMLYGLLAHEGAHAVADRKYGLLDLIGRCSNAEELYAANAVIEGYAQYAGRAACTEEWMMSGFNQLAEVISTTPEIEDAAERMIVEMTVHTFSFGYVQGEALVQAVAAARGDAGLEELFTAPPTSRSLVTNPGWFLDPDSRPKSGYQIEAGLDAFETQLADHDLAIQRMDFDSSLIRAAAAALPPAAVDQMVNAVVQSRVIIGQKIGANGQAFAVAALHACHDEARAADYLELSQQLMKAKEAMVKDSNTPVVASERTAVDQDGMTGFIAAQTVEAGGEQIATQTMLVHRGQLACEITLVQIEMEQEELIALGAAILLAAAP